MLRDAIIVPGQEDGDSDDESVEEEGDSQSLDASWALG